jgi:hypothetical protein
VNTLCHFSLNIVSHSRLCALARCRGEQFLAQNPLAGTSGHTRQINKLVNCSAPVFEDQYINSSDVFIRSGGRESP